MANIQNMAIAGSKMTLKMASRRHYDISVTSLIYVSTKGFPLNRNTTTYIKNPSWGPFHGPKMEKISKKQPQA